MGVTANDSLLAVRKQDGAAGGKRIGRGTGGGGHHETVGGKARGHASVHGKLKLDGVSGDAARHHHVVQRHGVAHAQGRAAGDLVVARCEGEHGVVKVWRLDAREVSKGSEVEPEQRNAGEAVDGGEHRAVAAEHHDGFRLFARAALGQPERGGQRRKALPHRIGTGFVPVHMEYNLSHGV